MSKKQLLLIFGALGGIFVAGLVGLLTYVSFKIQDIKTPLLEAFKSQIDGELQIGSAKVVFLPAGIDLDDVKLYAPGESVPSTSIKRAELRFDLIPLIQKKIETRVTVIEPEIRLHRGKDGKTNMERIFTPMLSGESKTRVSTIDKLWWKRLAVGRLLIKDAHFTASQEGSSDVTELKDLSIEANNIRFESATKPASLKIQYLMPRLSKAAMELKTKLVFEEARQSLRLEAGRLEWGPAKMNFGGEAGLPVGAQQDVTLNLSFNSEPIDLKKLSKILVDPLPATGTATCRGTITGTAFAPVLNMVLDAPVLSVSGKNISELHAELTKKDKPIEIKNTSFGIYGGSIGVSGQVLPGETSSAKLNIHLKSLSLAAMSGKQGNPARLNGDLQMASPNIKNPDSFSGGGKIAVGPFALPVVNLQNKVKVAEILSAGTALGQMVNVGMLSSSANVIGTQIDQVNATVKIAGNNITLAPFALGNNHFSATGNGNIVQQKSISGSGIFTLSRAVTAQLITSVPLRQSVTNGSGALSFPFSMSGPLDDPNVTVDSGYLHSLAAKAMAVGITNLLAGGIRPADMLNSALQNTAAGQKGPLGQILGGLTQSPSPQNSPAQTTTRTTTTTRSTTPKSSTSSSPPPTQKRSPSPLEQILFGK